MHFRYSPAKIIHAVGYESREKMKNVLCLQVLPRLRIVLPDSSDFWTSVLFEASAASLEALFPGIFPNLPIILGIYLLMDREDTIFNAFYGFFSVIHKTPPDTFPRLLPFRFVDYYDKISNLMRALLALESFSSSIRVD